MRGCLEHRVVGRDGLEGERGCFGMLWGGFGILVGGGSVMLPDSLRLMEAFEICDEI